ncbi:hypothetical protein ED733_001202 [Metarhizium rileyi]|uniref:Uncharacterized protein n=1 Tax=Metarhizium rileyi (strain RCEF 4871) TaxID=1649241 RepID=A0A5C6G646_METRR|nr:hypothetical protein ED733_001202 [Metarhizium rileyi]
MMPRGLFGEPDLAGRQAETPPTQVKRFLGGFPTPSEDVPATIIFFVLFALGAFLHISVYKANAKRGHKFLLSSLMFDFCMVRVVTCIFRILWAFIGLQAPGVILVANVFQNGGAVVVFAVNLFFVQRLIRAMHPSIGWHPVFSHFSLFLIWTCPVVTIMNIIAVCVSFLVPAQAQTAELVLKVGACWNMMLVVTPLLWLFVASAKPGSTPENFGVGDFRAKASLLVYSASVLTVGAAIRLAISFNHDGPERLFSKATLYTTQFMLEYSIVAAYAFFRIDHIYHIPNGSSGPGDYSWDASPGRKLWTSEEIEREIGKLGVRYDIMKSKSMGTSGPVFALLYPASTEQPFAYGDKELPEVPYSYGSGELPPRPRRVSRMDFFTGGGDHPERPPRSKRTTMFMTKDVEMTTTPNSPYQIFHD